MKKVGHFLLELMVLIERFFSIFKKPDCKITGYDFVTALANIKDGDLLCCRTDYEFSNLFLPGWYEHIAVFYDGWVYEATTEQVRKVMFAEWMFKKDHVAILRPVKPFTNMKDGVWFLNQCLGDPYNYNFFAVNTTKSWFCSEYAYKFLCASIDGFAKTVELRLRYGHETVSPNDFRQAVESGKFNLIGEFK